MKKRILTVLLSIAMVLPTAAVLFKQDNVLRAATDVSGDVLDGLVEINEMNFPDEEFRNIVTKYDTDGDGFLSDDERSVVTKITSSAKVTNIVGIEYFSELVDVEFTYGRLMEYADLSKNTKLERVFLGDHKIKSIDLSGCTELKYLVLQNNELTTLDLSHNTKLEQLVLPQNKITSLDLSANTELWNVIVSNNQLTTLKLDNNTKLSYLSCFNNQLTSLDLSNNLKLYDLDCGMNQLTTLDLSKNEDLKELGCSFNQLTSLDLSNNIWLTDLHCSSNQLTTLDVSMLPKLTALSCSENQLTMLDVINNTKLEELSCSGNALTSINVGMLPNLQMLDCGTCQLTTLDVSNNLALKFLYCAENQLASLDLSMLTSLEYFYCDSNQLTSLDLHANTALDDLRCSNNQLTVLDLSANTALNTLHCEYNQLTSLDLSKNVALHWVYCNNNQISDLNVLENAEMYVLFCGNNNLKSIDLSQCAELGGLSCEKNPLVELCLAGCPTLAKTYQNWTPVTDPEANTITYGSLAYGGRYGYLCCDIGLSIYLDKAVPDPIVPDPGPTNPDPIVPDPQPVDPQPVKEPSFEDFIERMYVIALNRPSEADGKAFWMNKVLNEGFTGGRVAYGFLVEAPEFLNRQLSDEDFIETLYMTFFDRPSEPAGKAFWLQKFAEGMTRAEMVNGFIDSIEWCNLCAYYNVKSGAPNAKAEKPSTNAVKFATRLYTCCLGREPDADGLQFWALRLTNLESSGAQAAYDFFHSAEFMNQGVDDTEYLIRLYRTFMGREPDADGLSFWQGHLATDMTRDQVLKGFAESQEFTNICNQYGIDRGTI